MLVVEIAPKPDVSPSIRKLPKQRQKPASEHRTSGAESTPSARLEKVVQPLNLPPPRLPKRLTSRRSSSRWRLRATECSSPRAPSFTTSSNGSQHSCRVPTLASMIETSVTEKLERLEAKRLGKVKNPRKSLEDADTTPGVRGIPAPVRRFVWARDQGQCTFESSGGRRCPERLGLQFHHDEPGP